MQAERRAHERLEVLGSLSGQLRVVQPASVRDLGKGGVLVETPYPLPLETLLELQLDLAGMAVVLKGRVVHCRVCDLGAEYITYRSGMELVDTPPQLSAAICGYLDTVRIVRGPARQPPTG